MPVSDSVMTVYAVRQLEFSAKPVFPVSPPDCVNHEGFNLCFHKKYITVFSMCVPPLEQFVNM